MKQAYIIGIAGGSAGGKSTFSDRLAERLTELLDQDQLLVFHMDDYFKEEALRPIAKAPVTGKSYLDDNHPETMDLNRLFMDLQEAAESGRYGIIIVEGLLTLWHDAICGYLDLKLFVDCRADERVVRRIRRNMEWGLTMDQISEVYLDLVRYRHDEYVEPSKWRADLILNGSNLSGEAVSMVACYAQSFLRHNGTQSEQKKDI